MGGGLPNSLILRAELRRLFRWLKDKGVTAIVTGERGENTLTRQETDSYLINFLKGEDFICYYGVPIIVKGQVEGVMEVFHRAALEPDSEWLDFLNALAGQAAIAIENAALFDRLQRSNLELALAYDARIEGWSHASTCAIMIPKDIPCG
jgi:GAF domain-containing protein